MRPFLRVRPGLDCSAATGSGPSKVGQVRQMSSFASGHWGHGKKDCCGSLGMSKVAHLPAHPGEEQCTLDEGKNG